MKFKLPKIPKLPKLPRLPKFPHLPPLKSESIKEIIPFLVKHKVATAITISLITFITFAMWYRSHLLTGMKSDSANAEVKLFNSTSQANPVPTFVLPSPDNTNSTSNTVLGTSDYYSPLKNTASILPSPFPTFPPIPTLIPVQNTNTTSTGNTAGNNSGNSNCTTGVGEPNAWYSDVYPNPPISANTGSVELIAVLRDCNKQTTSVNDSITVSLVSGDQNTQINGGNLPYTLTASNGQVSFYVTSQISGSVTLKVEDTTKSFTVTDINNHNPTISFANTNSNNSGNSNCTTGAGVANFWYSEVSPASPVFANVGSSVTFNVDIKDCSKNNVSSQQNLTVTQTSNDGSLLLNGSGPPLVIGIQNGHASFTVSSNNAGTVNLKVENTASSFTVTDSNNHNPRVVFSSSSGTSPTSTSAPANSPTSSPTNAPTAIPTQSATSTPMPTQSNSPTPILTPDPTRR